jgi:hypothetical protein
VCYILLQFRIIQISNNKYQHHLWNRFQIVIAMLLPLRMWQNKGWIRFVFWFWILQSYMFLQGREYFTCAYKFNHQQEQCSYFQWVTPGGPVASNNNSNKRNSKNTNIAMFNDDELYWFVDVGFFIHMNCFYFLWYIYVLSVFHICCCHFV